MPNNRNGVLLPGTHEARVDPAAVRRLIDQARAARFFGLKPEYAATVNDVSRQVVSVRIGRTAKQVVDYDGESVGMPTGVRQLQEAIDRAAGADRWVDGNLATIAWLDGQRFDFRSNAAVELAAAAMRMRRNALGRGAFLNAMIDRGLRLDVVPERSAATVGTIMLGWAAEHGEEALFDRLSAAGELRRADGKTLSAALRAGAGCNPAITRALIQAGADVRSVGENGTGLHAVLKSYGPCGSADEARVSAVADILIAGGVPLEARNSMGWTALMGCDSPVLVRLLLARGARVDASDEHGTTPVLATSDDRVAILLLRAGADPRARDEHGPLRSQAMKYHMPATLAWLDTHAIR